jgi:hypothetical protein
MHQVSLRRHDRWRIRRCHKSVAPRSSARLRGLPFRRTGEVVDVRLDDTQRLSLILEVGHGLVQEFPFKNLLLFPHKESYLLHFGLGCRLWGSILLHLDRQRPLGLLAAFRRYNGLMGVRSMPILIVILHTICLLHYGQNWQFLDSYFFCSLVCLRGLELVISLDRGAPHVLVN